MNIATAGSARRISRRARTACCASPRRAIRGSAMRCPRARCASISATRAAIRNSSAKARSATRRWARELGLTTGQAFDVKVRAVVERRERVNAGGTRWRTTMRYTLTNAKPQAVTVDLLQSGLWGDTRIEQESHAEPAPLRRRGAVARAGSGQWRSDGDRDLRHALLRKIRIVPHAPFALSLSKGFPFFQGRKDGASTGSARTVAGILAFVLAAPAAAQPVVTSAAPEHVAVTLYRAAHPRSAASRWIWNGWMATR